MATLAEAEAAFMKAHGAGDTAAAKVLADEVRRLRSAQPGPTVDKAEIEQPGPTQEKARLDPTSRTKMLREQLDEMPWYQQAGQALSDVGRFGIDTASFGQYDKARAYTLGTTIEEERQKTADARARSRGADTALDIAQALKNPRVLAQKGLGLFGLAGDAALYSGAQSYGHGSDLKEAGKDALLGGGLALGMGSAVPISRALLYPGAMASPLRGPWRAASHFTHSVSHPATGVPWAAATTADDLLYRALGTRAGQFADKVGKTAARTVPNSPTFRREDSDHVIRR